MSDIGIKITQATETILTPAAPWITGPNSLTGKGAASLRLNTGTVAVGDYLPGYIPREGALPKIDLSLDLEGGGDYEQLLSVTLQIADQMADGQSMAAWLKASGINLAGALVSLYYPLDVGYAIPAPYWTGVIRKTRLTDSRLELTCESDLDSDAIGEILSDRSLRPIVYGQASKVQLPPLPIPETVVSPLVPSISRTPSPPPIGGGQLTRIMVGSSDCAPAVMSWTDPVTKKNYVTLSYGEIAPNFDEWFPGMIVPSTNDWYLEIVSGKGSGQVRRLTAGSQIVIFTSITSPLKFPFSVSLAADAENVRKTELERTMMFEIDFPFVSPDDNAPQIRGLYTRTYDSNNVAHDAWDGGNHVLMEHVYDPNMPATEGAYYGRYYAPVLERSYVQVVRKGKSFALPINSGFDSKDKIYAKADSKMIPVNNAEELFRIDGQNLRIIPSAQSATDAAVYTRLDIDLDRTTILARGVLGGTDIENKLPELTSGTAAVAVEKFRIPAILEEGPPNSLWIADNHVVIAIGNPGWELDGATKLSLCLHAEWKHNILDDGNASLVAALQAYRSALMETWWSPYLPDLGATFERMPNIFQKALLRQVPYPASSVAAINSMPPSFYSNPGPPYNWLIDAVKVELTNGLEKSISHVTVFLGACREPGAQAAPENMVDFTLRQFAIFASRNVSLSDVYVDINGPTYQTGDVWTLRIHGGDFFGPAAVPLTSGIAEDAPIDDHPHALEDVFRRHTPRTWGIDPVDGTSIEQAYYDLCAKTQTDTQLPAPTLRPKIGLAITDSAPQVGDVCAQICRDGMLAGSRNGNGQRVAKAFLARTLLDEQDATILESHLIQGSISEAPTSSLAKLCSSPLIRYAQQAGAPTQYVQVLRPDAAAWNASYTLGFPDDATAMRAWNICHRGWMESGVAHAREIRLDTIPDIDSLLALIMAPRGNTFLDWISRPKRRLQPQVGLNHPAAKLPRGARVLVYHWRHAPLGERGTVESIVHDLETRLSRITLVMDLDP